MTWILHAIYLRSSEMNHAAAFLFSYHTFIYLLHAQAPLARSPTLNSFLSDVEATETVFLFHAVQ